METSIQKLQSLLDKGKNYFDVADENFLRQPYDVGKWSRKQVLGHLIDSAVNNLTRFTEINYQPQPYVYREYAQAELVAINDYQEMDTAELVQLWLSLNKQIARVMASVTSEQLDLKIKLVDESLTDLRHVMRDYPVHMEHHINQISGV